MPHLEPSSCSMRDLIGCTTASCVSWSGDAIRWYGIYLPPLFMPVHLSHCPDGLPTIPFPAQLVIIWWDGWDVPIWVFIKMANGGCGWWETRLSDRVRGWDDLRGRGWSVRWGTNHVHAISRSSFWRIWTWASWVRGTRRGDGVVVYKIYVLLLWFLSLFFSSSGFVLG